MKKFQILLLSLLAVVPVAARAQITDPGWYSAMEENVAVEMPTNAVAQARALIANGSPAPMGVLSGTVAIAETNTPEIQALADGLQHDPAQIFYYVHDHIRYDLYFGAKKGAALTLLEKSGNDFDQCALMVALLRASGYSDAGYKFGWTLMPYDDPYGYDRDLHHWLRLTLNNTNWTTTLTYLGNLFGTRGYGTIFNWGDNNTILIQRAWVTVTIGGINLAFDPSFKVSEPVAGINLMNATGFNSNSLATAAGGTVTGSSVSGLSETSLRGVLNGYATNYLNWLQSNAPNASVKDILGGWEIIPATYEDYLVGNWFYTYDFSGTVPILSWSNQPTNLMASMKLTFAGTNYSWWMPQLRGQRVTLLYDTSGVAQLWQDDTQLVQKTTAATDTNVVLAVNHPYGIWDFTNNVLIDGTKCDQTVTNVYQRTNATYNIMYAFEPDSDWLQARQAKLAAYRAQGLSDSSRQVASESLNVMGLNWLIQTALTEWMLAPQLNVLPHYDHRIGRMAQEGGHGYYVDVYMQNTGAYSAGGSDTANAQLRNANFDMILFFGSALEHGLIEQLQSSNLVAASTVKMLQLANTNGLTIYLASSTNWTTGANIKNSLTGYDTATLNSLTTYINTYGYTALLPQNGAIQIAGTGTWKGYGYELRLVATNGLVSDAKMAIAGGYNGGYSALPGVSIDPSYIYQSGVNQPSFYQSGPNYTPQPTSADPLDTADATFQTEHADLSLGQAEPHGMTLSLYYNGTRRNSNPAGLAGGWVHNYCCTAYNITAPQAGLGETTPAQMASMLAATTAAINYYNGSQRNAKNWLVTALIAKWGVDQLTKNGVSVNLGKESLQFVKQPNGVFTPPASCSATLTQSGSAFSLLMRHANRFNFSTAGLLTNIVDQYGQSLNLAYNSSNLVQTVTDWKSRTFTFNYTGGQMTSVSDNSTPSRSVSYGYSTAYNSQGDLTSFTDTEGKTSTYAYDTNHQITATFNALNQLVVSNIYNAMGRVTTQYTQGDTNKTWQIFWTPFQVYELNPAGDRRLFLYDDHTRLTSLFDQLNNTTLFYYDGQNHTVATVSPMGELTQFNYDGRHNLTNQIDPLGFTNQFVYDSQDNLTRLIDARGNPTTYGYNTQFSLTGQTNGAGDFVNFNFNSDGTLHTRTDAGGTALFDTYDNYGQLTHITYPGGLGGESFVNNSTGDPTSHTDANGNTTSFQYNARRQLTNSVAPTNVTVKISFDAVGNVASTTDARGNVTSNRWSATQHLLATTFPATPQGSPVITNAFDSRDWLTRTVDPLQQPTLYTNDAAGRLLAVTDPVQRTTKFGYDADGHKLAITNAAQEVTRQSWDARGSLIQLTDGAGHVSTRAYDAAGNQIILTNRNGKKWQFQFDGANRLTNTITPLGRSSSLAFNHQGLVSTTKDPASQPSSFYYDAKGRLTNRTDNVGTTFFGYDANGNQTNVTESGKTNSWTYDAYNRASSYRDVFGNLMQYRYDASGNLTNLVYPGGKNVYYAYDSINRLTNVTDWAGRKSSVAYDLASHITGITRPNGSYRTISYDAAGQATNIMEQMSNSLPIAIFKFNWTNSGNMAWEFAAPLPHTPTVPTRTMTYDDDNRLATFNGSSVTNDTNGNLTSAPLTNSTLVSYAYDARNRLLNVGGVTNAYDAMNNRVGLTSGTNSTVLVVNPNAKLPQVIMRIRNGVTNYYIYGVGLLYQITETATATNTLTYHYDFRGSTVALSADNGQVTDRIEYSAYGLTTYRVGLTDTPFLFNGRYGVQTDANGLLYMRARFYNPYLCRFNNPDPSGFAGGLNHYAYANGNPISLLDPFGLGAINDGSANSSWLQNSRNIPQMSQGNPNAIPYSTSDSGYLGYEALVIGNGVGNVNSSVLHGAAQINSTAYNMFLPLPGSGGATSLAASEQMIVSVQAGRYMAFDGGILAARNAALDNLNVAQRVASQMTDLVEGAMRTVNNAGQAGLNSAQMLQANQALQAAYAAQRIALRNALAAQKQWEFINSAAVNGVRLLPP